ncbi:MULTISPECIES: spore coat protein [Dehalobacter]|uniref:Spore coat protein n=2 Tax=Dehalobacter restrictus TaxID=55583 RepID=A0A857DGW3_9FIRM|nr:MULTISPECIES: spore coat protein [Dehalobacter]AHF08999.1 Coat F domain protein [Dehalobacter restrictus DSM 9455]MCG1025694.1 spore coat protein [Dehalobacter sp.]MDJ0305868.1 spore coat protein [Dehalobacter sp.]OCZ50407.1 coat protein F [Dehalobacter sp. TeCB1]QGZ99524.1 spore coat protein [Dehalobacter restrictus]
MMQLTSKERSLLEDSKSHEELCIKKYNNYAGQTQDLQLQQLFQSLAQKEQEHLTSLNQILSGGIPNIQQGQQQQQPQFMTSGMGQAGMVNQQDADLCQDMLSTEKHIASTYNTAIFEFRDTNIRRVLNHIQTEEQQHGESIYNYMQSKGMYQVH